VQPGAISTGGAGSVVSKADLIICGCSPEKQLLLPALSSLCATTHSPSSFVGTRRRKKKPRARPPASKTTLGRVFRT